MGGVAAPSCSRPTDAAEVRRSVAALGGQPDAWHKSPVPVAAHLVTVFRAAAVGNLPTMPAAVVRPEKIVRQRPILVTCVAAFAVGLGVAGRSPSHPRPTRRVGVPASASASPPASSPASSPTRLPWPDLLPGMPAPVSGDDVYAAAGPDEFRPAVAGARSLVYVPNNGTNDFDVIDPATFRVIDRFPAGNEPQLARSGASDRRRSQTRTTRRRWLCRGHERG